MRDILHFGCISKEKCIWFLVLVLVLGILAHTFIRFSGPLITFHQKSGEKQSWILAIRYLG